MFIELRDQERLLTHNYVLVETTAVVQHRLGATATRTLLEHLIEPLYVVWVDEFVHRQAVSAFLAGGSTRLSLVDRTSFEVMRRLGIETAFAFDRDFADEGFATVP